MLMKKRTIIIGDVHGCLSELNLLLKKVQFQVGEDQLYFTGDLINRGPNSLGVFKRFKELGAVSVLGNHEYWALKRHVEASKKVPKINVLQQQFGEHYINFIEDIKRWPLYVETEDFMLVHAGLVPGEHPKESDPFLITSIRTWDGAGNNINSEKDPAWFDFYQENKLVIFGHWARLEGVFMERVIGLDSGCVYGKKLSALILPEKQIVSVDALKIYAPISGGQ